MKRASINSMIAILACTMCGICWRGHCSDFTQQGANVVGGQAKLGSVKVIREQWTANDGLQYTDAWMTVDFWLPREPKESAKHYLIKMHGLGPIVDDTGRVLSTPDRLKAISFLDYEETANFRRAGTLEGPMFTIKLDAPAKQANQIMQISAKVDVSGAKVVVVEFADLAGLNGKVLEHPKLKNFKIRVQSVAVEDGFTTVELHVAEPAARLLDWEVFSNKEEVRFFGQGGGETHNGGVLFDKIYWGTNPKAYSLRLEILEIIETKAFELNFKGIKLP